MSARLGTRERQPYLALTGELWVSFVSYLEKIERYISGTHCTLSTPLVVESIGALIQVYNEKAPFQSSLVTAEYL